jgi:hypothetical protein
MLWIMTEPSLSLGEKLSSLQKDAQMLRLITTIVTVAALSAAPAHAPPKGGAGNTVSGANGWTQSENANANSCFGQARAWFASTMGQGTNPYYPGGGTSNGDVISQRAQDGTNRSNNEEFIEAYCALTGQD